MLISTKKCIERIPPWLLHYRVPPPVGVLCFILDFDAVLRTKRGQNGFKVGRKVEHSKEGGTFCCNNSGRILRLDSFEDATTVVCVRVQLKLIARHRCGLILDCIYHAKSDGF